MTDMKIWFVTGAGRGMGTSIAKAALNAGHAVVATGRKTDAVKAAIGHYLGDMGDVSFRFESVPPSSSRIFRITMEGSAFEYRNY
jgi:NAD(P)-dependent dehydrogenase (short-subunit alcohol dehydrogenase family)